MREGLKPKTKKASKKGNSGAFCILCFNQALGVIPVSYTHLTLPTSDLV